MSDRGAADGYDGGYNVRNGPQEGSIQLAKVIRVEPAYCILQLRDFSRVRGLLHHSEMNLNGAQLNETVQLNDVMYTQILSIAPNPDGGGPPRIKLSTRHIDIETGNPIVNHAQEQKESITSCLNSTIGMGVALDPMSHLILKGQSNNNNNNNKATSSLSSSLLINGYALVGDDEGEPEAQVASSMGHGRGNIMTARGGNQDGGLLGSRCGQVALPTNDVPRAPLGRGRGTTLPAWMTRGDNTADKKQQDEQSSQDDDDNRKRHGRKEKKKRKHSRKRHRHDREDDNDDERRHRSSSRKHRRRSRDEERKLSHRSSSRPHDSSHDSDDSRRHRKKHHRKRDRRRSRSDSFSDDNRQRDDKERHNGDDSDGRRHRKKHYRREKRHRSRSFDDDNNDRRPDSPSVSRSSDDEQTGRQGKKHERKSRRRNYSGDSVDDRSERRRRESGVRDRDRKDAGRDRQHDDAGFSSVAEAEKLIAELEEKKSRRNKEQ